MDLIVCADDFGLNTFVDQGIIALTSVGRLTAASCLVDGPSAAGNAHALAALDVDIGLHLNFTEALPGAPTVRSLKGLIIAAYARRLDPAALVRDVQRQLDRFETLFGRAPEYVDGHQHVHQFPRIREALLTVLQQRYPARLPWLRTTRRPRTGTLPFAFKAAVIDQLGAQRFATLAQAAGAPTNTDLLGVYDFQGTATDYRQWLGGWLARASSGSLLMCHPAAGGADARDVLGAQRLIEYEVLASAEFPALLQTHGLRLQRQSRRR